MKKKTLTGGLVISLTLLSACAYKTEYGVDKCGKHYTDTIYRTYSDTCNETSNSEIVAKPNCKVQKNKKEVSTKKIISKQVKPVLPKNTPILKCNEKLRVTVTGQGVAPCHGTCSPAQAYAMAKRAAIADAYRLMAEKVKGVYVEGNDYIKNMAVKKSVVRTHVAACIRNANVTETTFKDGLCEVEMEITL